MVAQVILVCEEDYHPLNLKASKMQVGQLVIKGCKPLTNYLFSAKQHTDYFKCLYFLTIITRENRNIYFQLVPLV